MSTRSMSSLSRTLVLGLLAALVGLTPAPAQVERQRRILVAVERMQALLREAEELQELGQEERAADLRQEATQLRQRIGTARQRIGTADEREQDRPNREDPEAILRGLREGMDALRALGRMDALEQMERITAGVEREIAGRRAREEDEGAEARGARRQLEVLGLALEVVTDAGREDAAEILARAYRAAQMASAGQALDDFRVPSRGTQAEGLMVAARVLRERDQLERAALVEGLARRLADQARSERSAAPRTEENAEIRAARRQVEVMRLGLRALAAAERDDAADLLERAIVVREMAIEGRRGEEAAKMRESAPNRGNQAELLMLAARILAERGQEDRAEMVMEYAQQLAGQARRIRAAGEQRERPVVRERESAGRARTEQIESLETRLRQLQESIQELQAALRAIRRDR